MFVSPTAQPDIVQKVDNWWLKAWVMLVLRSTTWKAPAQTLCSIHGPRISVLVFSKRIFLYLSKYSSTFTLLGCTWSSRSLNRCASKWPSLDLHKPASCIDPFMHPVRAGMLHLSWYVFIVRHSLDRWNPLTFCMPRMRINTESKNANSHSFWLPEQANTALS